MEAIRLTENESSVVIITNDKFPKELMLEYHLGDGEEHDLLGDAMEFQRQIKSTKVKKLPTFG